MATETFKLFANCIPVRGARRSTICDLQRRRVKLIPNSLFELLTEHKDRPVAAIKAAYHGESDAQIDEYFGYLVNHGWGFWCEDPGDFPDIELEYQMPNRITNAIVDFDADSTHTLAAILPQLEALGCISLQLRCYSVFCEDQLEALLDDCRTSRLRSIEILSKYSPDLDEARLLTICRKHSRLHRLILHGAPEYRQVKSDERVAFMGLLMYHSDIITSHDHCGIVDPMYLQTDMNLFFESQDYNTCLNRKISVGADGQIRNCPSLAQSYGHIADTTLAAALDRGGFQSLWRIKKDDIEICRDCEFRHICTDCRAFIQDPANPYSKPAKCSYDPYTATWGESPDQVPKAPLEV